MLFTNQPFQIGNLKLVGSASRTDFSPNYYCEEFIFEGSFAKELDVMIKTHDGIEIISPFGDFAQTSGRHGFEITGSAHYKTIIGKSGEETKTPTKVDFDINEFAPCFGFDSPLITNLKISSYDAYMGITNARECLKIKYPSEVRV